MFTTEHSSFLLERRSFSLIGRETLSAEYFQHLPEPGIT